MARDFANNAELSIDSDLALYKITGELTLAAWVQNDKAGFGSILSKMGASGSFGWQIAKTATDNFPVFQISGNGTSLMVATGTTNMGTGGTTWYHVAGTYKPSTHAKVWLNGVNEATNTTSIPAALFNTTAHLQIGRQHGDANPWDGRIAHCALWSEELNADEIAALARGTSPLLIRRWALL